MKKLLLYFTLLMACGCQALSQASQPSIQTSTGCPEKPKAALNDPEEIQLNNQTVSKSGQASADTSVGYTFEAESGQRLNYRTSDDICIWIYRPDTELLNSGELAQTGKYTLQVSAPKGSTTFKLEMSLDTSQASQPSVPSSPSTETSTSTEDSTSTSAITEVADLSQDEALELVENWYKAKPQIFGPSFDESLVEKYTTGKLYEDKLKPGGSIDWLRSNDRYYTYEYSRVNKVISFSNSGSQPSMIANISEELYLHGPKGIDEKSSGPYNADFIYFYAKNNGVWKIYDYKKLS